MKFQRLLGYLVLGGVIVAAGGLLPGFAGTANAAGDSGMTVGYFDMERIQNEVPDFIKLKETMKDKKEEYDLFKGYILTQNQNTMKALQEKANQEKKGKSDAEKAEIDKRYGEEAKKKNGEFAAQLQAKETEIKKLLNEQSKAAIAKLNKFISEVATEQKLSLVVEKNTLFFGGTDITQQIVDKSKKESGSTSTGKSGTKPK